MRAIVYHRTGGAAAAEEGAAPQHLEAAVTGRGWRVVDVVTEHVPVRRHAWPARRRVAAAVAAGTVDVIVVEHLAGIARSPYDLVDVVGRWLERGVHLWALDDTIGTVPLDTTHPTAALRLRDALDLLRILRRHAHSEACRDARALDPHPPPGGRPRVLVNDYELIPLYESGLSIREVQRRLTHRGAPASYGTLQARLAHLRRHGRIDETARSQAIEDRGGLPKGGRPRRHRRSSDQPGRARRRSTRSPAP